MARLLHHRRRSSLASRALWVSIALAGSLLVVVSDPASAQGDASDAMTEEDAYRFLAEQNAELSRAYAVLPKRYGADPAAERNAINDAEAIVMQVVARLRGKHRAARDAFATMQANIARLNTQISQARLAADASEAHYAIVVAHASGLPATSAQLEGLGAKAAALTAQGGELWAPVSSFFSSAEATHRQQADELTQLASRQAEAARAAEEKQKANGAMREANAARRAAEDVLALGAGPVEESMLRAFQIAANKVATADLGAGRYYLHQLRLLRLASALAEPDLDDAAALSAQVLEGGLVTSGRTKSSTLKVSFKAEADWCYGVALRFHETQDGSLEDLAFTQDGKDRVLQGYAIPQPVPGWQRFEGVCTVEKGKVTARAKVVSEGGSLRYVVVGWPRKDAPPGLFAHAEVRPGDRCDFEGFSAFFTQPVPGTVVSVLGRPHLVLEASLVGLPSLKLIDVAGRLVELPKQDLQKAAPSPLPPLASYRFGGCSPAEVATHKRSVKLSKCYDRVERRHARAVKRAERKKDRASTDEASADADEALKRALKAEDDDRAKTCGSQERDLAAEGLRQYDRLVGVVEAGQVPMALDRTKTLLEEERAKPGLR